MVSFRGVALTAPYPRSSLRVWGRDLLLAFVLFSLPVNAQDPGLPQRPGPLQAPGGRVSVSIDGQVVAEQEGANLAGVHVTLTDFRGAIRGTYQTRAGGAFAFTNLPPGRYTLVFSHPDFVEHRQIVELVFASHQGLIITLFRNARAASSPSSATVPVWALQIPGKAQKEFNKGLEALERGDAKLSVDHLELAIQLYPRFATAYGALGTAYSNAGDSKAAAAAFEKALEIDENLFPAYLGLGTLCVTEQRYPDAEKHLARARTLKPDDWHVHFQLGELYWRTDEWAKAEENLRRAIELHGKLPRMHLLMINVLAGQEKFPEALAAMENFLKLFSEDRFAPQVRQKRDLLMAHIEKTAGAQPAKKP